MCVYVCAFACFIVFSLVCVIHDFTIASLPSTLLFLSPKCSALPPSGSFRARVLLTVGVSICVCACFFPPPPSMPLLFSSVLGVFVCVCAVSSRAFLAFFLSSHWLSFFVVACAMVIFSPSSPHLAPLLLHVSALVVFFSRARVCVCVCVSPPVCGLFLSSLFFSL